MRKITIALTFRDLTEEYFVEWDNGKIVTTKNWRNAWTTLDMNEAMEFRKQFINYDEILSAVCQPKRF